MLLKISILLAFFHSKSFAGHESDEVVSKVRSPGLIYFHIPKVGGSFIGQTLSNTFEIGVDGSDRFDVPRNRNQDFLLRREVSMGAGTLPKVVELNARANKPIVLFIRDPYSRVISHLRFWKQHEKNPGIPHASFMQGKSINDIEFLKSDEHYLSLTYSWYVSHLSPPDFPRPYEDMSEAKVDLIVKYVLQNVDYIGTQEEMEESLGVIQDIIGKTLISPSDRVNPTNTKIERITDSESIDFLKQKLKWERMLYEKLLAAKRSSDNFLKQKGLKSVDNDRGIVTFKRWSGSDPETIEAVETEASVSLLPLPSFVKRTEGPVKNDALLFASLNPHLWKKIKELGIKGTAAANYAYRYMQSEAVPDELCREFDPDKFAEVFPEAKDWADDRANDKTDPNEIRKLITTYFRHLDKGNSFFNSSVL